MADRFLDLRPLLVSESSWPARGRFARKPWQPRGVKGMYPAPKGLFVAIWGQLLPSSSSKMQW
jgi:hypothetical protein